MVIYIHQDLIPLRAKWIFLTHQSARVTDLMKIMVEMLTWVFVTFLNYTLSDLTQTAKSKTLSSYRYMHEGYWAYTSLVDSHLRTSCVQQLTCYRSPAPHLSCTSFQSVTHNNITHPGLDRKVILTCTIVHNTWLSSIQVLSTLDVA